MTGQSQHEITQLLQAWRNGDQAALERLMPVVYAEMHRLGHIYMRRERAGHTLQTSALVNEAYIRLIDATGSIGRIAPISSPSAPMSYARY